MTHQTVTVFDAAMSLTPSDRAELASRLLQSLEDTAADAEIDRAWADEALARLAQYDAGTMDASPVEEVLLRLRGGRNP